MPNLPARKLLVITHYFPAHGGGVEGVANQIARGLVADWDYQIKWFASDCDATPDAITNIEFCPMPCWNGVERLLGLPYPLPSFRACVRLWREIAHADFIHIHDYIYAANLLALIAALRHNVPILITQHIGFIPYRSVVARNVLALLNSTIGAISLKCASQVVFISSTVSQYFSKFSRLARAPLLIPNGVDTNLFTPANANERARRRESWGLAADRPVVLFVGRFVEKKGVLLIRYLAEDLNDCQWVLAGSGPIDPTQWHLPNVRVIQNVPQSRLVHLYQAADLVILPSVGEGFPLVVQEAMACGVAAMVSPETANALKGVSDHVYAVAVEGSAASGDWAAAIRDAIQDIAKHPSKSMSGVEFARRNWSWKTCVSQYQELFNSMKSPRV
ncbi:MAG: glycosyltransferase family 4 protein [Aeromicrobium sp.]|nr:glycosyltransferase family 4 protein [Burkholderiales bacterium]